MGALRRVSAVALGGLMVCAGGVSPASAGTPATVTTDILSGSSFLPCGTTTLSFISGTSRSVFRLGQSASGNQAVTQVVTINGVVTDGDGNVFNIHGVQSIPTTIQVKDGVETYQGTFVEKFVLLDPHGGLVDKFNSTANYSFTIDNGEFTETRYHFIDKGTCSL